MSKIPMILPYTRDINASLVTERPLTLMMQGDARAQTIRIYMMDDGEEASLDGMSANGYLIRSDGVKVPCKGTIKENVIDVTLNDHCYAVPGAYAMHIRISDGSGAKRTIFRAAGMIESEGDGPLLDSENVIPSIDDLLAQIERMEKATTDAETQAAAAKTQAAAAETAAADAAGAAKLITGLTIESEEASRTDAVLATVNGAYRITLKLRRGAPGYGFKFLGFYPSLETLEAYVLTPAQGDMYLVGTSLPYSVYMYDTTNTSGFILIGFAAGESIQTVAGVRADADGNVPVTAANVGARPSNWMPTANETGALATDALVIGGTLAQAANWTESDGLYVQTVTAINMTASHTPIIDLGVSGATAKEIDEQEKEWAKIVSAESGDGTITLTAKEKPTINLGIRFVALKG